MRLDDLADSEIGASRANQAALRLHETTKPVASGRSTGRLARQSSTLAPAQRDHAYVLPHWPLADC
jgi:hypothetical protein